MAWEGRRSWMSEPRMTSTGIITASVLLSTNVSISFVGSVQIKIDRLLPLSRATRLRDCKSSKRLAAASYLVRWQGCCGAAVMSGPRKRSPS